MTTARTYAMQTCPVCRSEFQPRSNRVVYCSRACMDKANHSRYYRRGETAAIVPSERTPVRKEPMTEDEFAVMLAGLELPTGERPMRRLLVERLAKRRTA